MKSRNIYIDEYTINPNAKAGLSIRKVQEDTVGNGHDVLTPHRDKHYMLVILRQGSFKMMIDFVEYNVDACSLLLISPGQVHQVLEFSNIRGWVVNFEPSLIDSQLQFFFENNFAKPIRYELSGVRAVRIDYLTNLMYEIISEEPDEFSASICHNALKALLGLAAGQALTVNSKPDLKMIRGKIIEQNFKQLLKENFKSWKKPAQYAYALSISVPHLNDTIKRETGKPVSKQIQEISILEAKRLLCFSTLTVKEICFEIGYSDPIYFSKLFKNITSFTPTGFKAQFYD